MSLAVNDLEGLGLRLGLLPDGRLSVHGLEELPQEVREGVIEAALANKPTLLRELAQRAGVRLCVNCGRQLSPMAGAHVVCCSGACFGGAGRVWQEGRLVHTETGWW